MQKLFLIKIFKIDSKTTKDNMWIKKTFTLKGVPAKMCLSFWACNLPNAYDIPLNTPLIVGDWPKNIKDWLLRCWNEWEQNVQKHIYSAAPFSYIFNIPCLKSLISFKKWLYMLIYNIDACNLTLHYMLQQVEI